MHLASNSGARPISSESTYYRDFGARPRRFWPISALAALFAGTFRSPRQPR